MRFNAKELACLACQSSDQYDKEGVLFVKERQEGFFRKGEVYVERLFRLRGNLLFYFKTKEVSSEVVGVIVLERCLVQLDDDADQSLFSFVVVFEGDERGLRLATRTEPERDSWIERLHIAGFECLRIQLQSLREQLKARTGCDPIKFGSLAVDGFGTVDSISAAGETSSVLPSGDSQYEYEISLASQGLPNDSSGLAPNTYTVVQYQKEHGGKWISNGHTEIVERCSSPKYLATVGFSDSDGFSETSPIKVTVYCVKERLTHTMAPIGYAVFTMLNVLNAFGSSLTLRLNSVDSHDVGSVSVTAWPAEDHFIANTVTNSQEHVPVVGRRSMSIASVQCQRGLADLRADYANVATKTFRFPVSAADDQHLIVLEYCAESRLTFSLPAQLLKLMAEEEKKKIEMLESLGSLSSKRCSMSDIDEEIGRLMQNYSQFLTAAHQFGAIKDVYFKASTTKNNKEVTFAPTNLHLQRMSVFDTTLQTSACYDIITVGVFTASAFKYKHGGLRRLKQQLHQRQLLTATDNAAPLLAVAGPSSPWSRLAAVTQMLRRLEKLESETLEACDSLCAVAAAGDRNTLQSAATLLTEQTRRLIEASEEELVDDSIAQYSYGRPAAEAASSSQRGSDCSSSHQADVSWKWSGTDFVKSPTEEPWDLTKLNTQASLMCVVSKVDELMTQSSDSVVLWLDALHPLVIKLKRCIEVMSSRATVGLTFFALQDTGVCLPELHTVSYRRDVVFSQALTAATTSVITKLSSVHNELALRQFVTVGILLQFESLISCHGDEMGMLEDMDTGMHDLASVRFVITSQNDDSSTTTVSMSGSRYSYTVTIQLTESVYSSLPSGMFTGRAVRITPIMFTVGINEQATFAEKFGDVSLQETMNQENYQRLRHYYEQFVDFHQNIGKADPAEMRTLRDLLSHLSVCVVSKKSKNIEVLHIAAEVCRSMNGARFTGCKSAKDRTAMAVTLEQVHLLQREHNLASDVFLHALECFRSEGVRRSNTLKNTGVRKYAFNNLQLLYLPKLYRPPPGTYGNIES